MTSMMARFIAAIAATALLAMTPASGQETYPSRAIKIIAPFPAGAPVDSGDIVMKRLAEDRALFAEIVEKAGIVPQ